MSVNKVMILGHLGRDPEVRYLPNGDAIANVTIATTESWKDKATGEKRDATEWHRVSFFGKLAEIVGQYLKKGSQVYVEGSLRTRKWQDKEGVDRYTTEIRADSMQMLDKKNESAQDGGYTEQPRASATRPARQTSKPNQNQNQNQNHQTHNGFDDMDDDIPF